MNRRIRHSALVLGVLLLSRALWPVVIKIGSIAPSRSIWDKKLNELAREWAKISAGTVRLQVYPGGIVGGELETLTKMRMGILGGAVFTVMGMTTIDGDAFVLTTPFLINTDEEFHYVFDRLKPVLEKQIETKGYKVLGWILIGWEYFFSKDKVLYPEDMKKHKLSVTTVGPELAHAWKRIGYQIIPNDLKDLLMALQSGLATAFYLPPLLAGTGQFFALAPHMLNLRMAPVIGALVLTRRAWESVPAAYREPMRKAAGQVTSGLYQQTLDLERDVIGAMKKNGLIIHEPPADALEKWRATGAQGMEVLVGKSFSREIYERLLALLEEFKRLHDH